ncbi:MAG: tRNA pseudouridine(55) synthase TruB [Clostridia bacterium]|nr:tRNA pseudouridine(55) synthase TruB [Clostridia bacterium]
MCINNSGIVLIDKEAGRTSFSVDSAVKKIINTRKVGHSGTLDPFATGLLPVFVNDALRFVRYTDDYDKAYRATAVLGFSTDSMDIDGEFIDGYKLSDKRILELSQNDYEEIKNALDKIKTTRLQMPPKYSAKKINGKKAYDLARAGVEFELKPNQIEIYSIDIHSIVVSSTVWEEREYKTIEVDFSVECSKGTYIRTICNDLGELLGTGAFCKVLRRTKCGPFSVEDAVSIDEVKELLDRGENPFIPGDEALQKMTELKLDDVQFSMIKVGKKLKAKPFRHILDTKDVDKRYRATYMGKTAAVLYYSEEDVDGKVLPLMRIERMLWK